MAKNKKPILVTGGAGFIGSNLVERLLEEKEKVIVFDNLSTGRIENIKNFQGKPNFRFIKGDLNNQEDVERVVKEVDFIFHQAAIPSVARSISDPKKTFEANILGTLNLLIAARKHRIKKIIYASSSSIYGETKILPKREEMPVNPLSPYALSKYSGEKVCQFFSSLYNLPTLSLRYFNVFGPRQNPNSEYSAVIPKFIFSFLKNERPIIYGDGKQTRDFTFVGNVVEANLKALYSQSKEGDYFNIACGRQTSLLELVEILNKIFSKNLKPYFQKKRTGDVVNSFADIKKSKEILRYQPKVFLEKGLEETVKWFLNYENKN